MEIKNSFDVPLPAPEAFELLLDVPRIAACMPGATLSSMDGDTFTGTVRVKLGPVSITYAGEASITERDTEGLRAVIAARGKETRGSGDAKARVEASLTPIDGGTRVDVVTDLAITGKPAQLGRGLIADVSGKLIGQFANALAADIAATANGATPSPTASATQTSAAPMSGGRASDPSVSTYDPGVAGARSTPAAEASNEIDLLALVGDRIPKQSLLVVAALLLGWLAGRRSRHGSP
jgi:carbon monoxide dehydrogenase subunit G